MDLLHVPMRCGLPLLGGSKLRAHISSQPGVLGKTVPLHLLLMEEPGFVLAMSNDTLKKTDIKNTKTQEYLKEEGNKGED